MNLARCTVAGEVPQGLGLHTSAKFTDNHPAADFVGGGAGALRLGQAAAYVD
jgi:hypothetical protein